MINLILSITMMFFGGSFTDMEELDHDLYGVWQEATEPTFVKIGTGSDFGAIFQRVQGREVVSYGTLDSDGESILNVTNLLSKEKYDLIYQFSPSGNTVVITKPNSDQAWVFFRVGQ